ncbi:sigma-E factor regulatory protein RseB domain-containing protein [Sedimentibacter sp.]|uniref:LolA family protein n=1 Tax=Sedimentibacter sp. TaxID=1960295 RepID=UPI002897227E|nr:sigma-E factor regulatory protein RseB domain-containing protein [Sedimentibacter sp.]
MNDNEKKLSDFIDSLNNEKKPDIETDSEELDSLYNAVRQVKSLKEPVMPDKDFSYNITQRLKEKKKTPIKNKKRICIGSIAGIAAILVVALIMNFINPINSSNIVYAMEQAYNGIKAYHGTLEVVLNNEAGEEHIQSILDIWVDKNDNYYIEISEGSYKGLKTISDGKKVWQLSVDENAENTLPIFTETYEFIFELGNEIDEVKNAEFAKIIGDDKIAGRSSYVMEVTPKGGLTYKLWVDKETKLPLQKQGAMNKAIQYTTRYTEIDFVESIPEDLITIDLNEGFKEVEPVTDKNTDIIEGKNIVGHDPETIVGVDMEIEKAEQIAADSGSSPWKLDPVYVAQVFLSLQISPDGIVGDYPVDYDELVIVENNGTNVMINVNSEKTDIKTVYLSRLIRQNDTGIWTVTGYDE